MRATKCVDECGQASATVAEPRFCVDGPRELQFSAL